MATLADVLKMQLKHLLSRSQAKYATTGMLIIVSIAFIETCMRFYGADSGEVPSAAYAWMGNMDGMQIQASRVLYFYIIFLIAGTVFSDSFFVDAKNGMSNLIATRCSLHSYIVSAGILTLTSGFLVVMLPLLFSQFLALVAYPFSAEPNAFFGVLNYPAQDSSWAISIADNALFSELLFKHPYLNNLVFILYVSLWAGIASLASFTISLYTRKQRLIVLGTPTLFYLLSLFIMPANLALAYYLYPCIFMAGLSRVYFIAAPLIIIALLAAGILISIKGKRDILL